jgi:hypothetical protein
MSQRAGVLFVAVFVLAACSSQATTPTPVASATIAPTTAPAPSPSLVAPQPAAPASQPAPSPTGGIVFVGKTFVIKVPDPWTIKPLDPNLPNRADFFGPDGAVLTAHSVQEKGMTLKRLAIEINASLKQQTGADPAQTESITLDGVPAVLVRHHYVQTNGLATNHLDAFCVRGDRVYEIFYANAAGHEAADRAFFLAVIATFAFLG